MDGMEVKELLSSDQAEELFSRESALIDGDDLIPLLRASELLGASAVAYVKVFANRKIEHTGPLLKKWSVNIVGGVLVDKAVDVDFLTWPGFSLAVTYHNATLQAEKENPGKAVQG